MKNISFELVLLLLRWILAIKLHLAWNLLSSASQCETAQSGITMPGLGPYLKK